MPRKEAKKITKKLPKSRKPKKKSLNLYPARKQTFKSMR